MLSNWRAYAPGMMVQCHGPPLRLYEYLTLTFFPSLLIPLTSPPLAALLNATGFPATLSTPPLLANAPLPNLITLFPLFPRNGLE